MYEWIWRHLPFGLPGKIIGSLVLAAAVVALLWFKIFALIEPILPNNDGQVTQSGTSSGGAGVLPTPSAGVASPPAPPGTAPPGTAPPGTAPPGTAPPGTAPPRTAPGTTSSRAASRKAASIKPSATAAAAVRLGPSQGSR